MTNAEYLIYFGPPKIFETVQIYLLVPCQRDLEVASYTYSPPCNSVYSYDNAVAIASILSSLIAMITYRIMNFFFTFTETMIIFMVNSIYTLFFCLGYFKIITMCLCFCNVAIQCIKKFLTMIRIIICEAILERRLVANFT